jgi:hypothetical protein
VFPAPILDAAAMAAIGDVDVECDRAVCENLTAGGAPR